LGTFFRRKSLEEEEEAEVVWTAHSLAHSMGVNVVVVVVVVELFLFYCDVE